MKSGSASKFTEQNEKMKTSVKVGLIVLTIILLVLSCLSVRIFGKSCTVKVQPVLSEHYSVDYDEKIVECVNQQRNGDSLLLEFRSVADGDTLVSIYDEEEIVDTVLLYVHASGILSIDNKFGKTRGAIVFAASFIILLMLFLFIQFRRYQHSTKKCLCRYANAWLLGTVIFIVFTLIVQIISFVTTSVSGEEFSVLLLCKKTLHSAQTFTTVLLPVAVVIALGISISNLVLMKHEGVRLRNMLGFFLGILLCAGSVIRVFIYPLFDALGVDVHNESGIGVIVVLCLEDIISVTMAYLECILLGTAISAVRAAKHIPVFDKDFILILGCQIKKDGGLTKLLQSRTDRAIEFAEMQKKETGKEIVFVPSGGKGTDEVIAEAEAIHNYLVDKGISEEKILVENRSESTNQNIRFSYDLIQKMNPDANIAFSTTNYHVFRAGCIADEINIPMEGIGAKTKRYFWINAFIREFIAAIHCEKRHLIVSLVIILCCVVPAEIIINLSKMI